MSKKQANKRIYMDYCASTPLDPKVFKAMELYLKKEFGNAGSLHSWGQAAIKAVDDAREKIAHAIGAQFEEIVFTGSATEANNLALRGAVKMAGLFKRTVLRNIPQSQQAWFSPQDGIVGARGKKILPQEQNYSGSEKLSALNKAPRIIISAIEHESVLETAKDLEREGVDVVYLPVDKHGAVDLGALKKALTENTILVSVMYVNNVIGTIQPIAEIAKLIKEFKAERFFSQKDGVSLAQPLVRPLASRPRSSRFARNRARSDSETLFLEKNLSTPAFFPLFHTDAVQAFPYLDCDVKKLNMDMMTLSAHKIGGPKGTGALYTRVKLPGITTGGEQEFKMRAGTPNTAGIAGFGKAVEIAGKERMKNTKKVYTLRAELLAGIKKIYPDVQWNGLDFESEKARFAPHIANMFFPAHLAEDLLMQFDRAGVAVSAGAACSARALKSSHVLQAIGCQPDRIACSIRFSLGHETTKEEVQETIRRLKKIIRG